MTKQQTLAMLRDDNLWTAQPKRSLQGLTAKSGRGTRGLGWRDDYNAAK